ncbi:MAG: hypothetical protein KIS88_00480 [Anaerolineales bacterium]|nr:hypothetical protein [Anaerolineales bacterium]
MVKIGAILAFVGALAGSVAMAGLGLSVLSFGPPVVPGLLFVLLHLAAFIYIFITCYKVLRGAAPTWLLLAAPIVLVTLSLIPASTVGSFALLPSLACLLGAFVVLVGADELH